MSPLPPVRTWLPFGLIVGAMLIGVMLWRDRVHAGDAAVLKAIIATQDSTIAAQSARARLTDTTYARDTSALTIARQYTSVATAMLDRANRTTAAILAAAQARLSGAVPASAGGDSALVSALVAQLQSTGQAGRTIAAAAARSDSACTVTIATCQQRVAQRDSIIAGLRALRADERKLAAIAAPRMQPYAVVGYDVGAGAIVPRAGVGFRFFLGLTAIAEAEYPLGRSGTNDRGGRLLVGIRRVF